MERIWSVERYWSEDYCSNYYDVIVNRFDVKHGRTLRFWGNER